MITTTRANSTNEDFQYLVEKLDEDLRIRDGKDHLFYAQFNKIDHIKYAVIAFDDGKPVGCGAIKEYAPFIMEVKRMYVITHRRGEGIASFILKELEQWAMELNSTKCLLETGKKQPEAVAMYKKNGYNLIQNFGQYKKVENSICFEKILPGIE
ncbi:MAG: GNAT family N-acetyltransferase [Ferruginibacter sp.]